MKPDGSANGSIRSLEESFVQCKLKIMILTALVAPSLDHKVSKALTRWQLLQSQEATHPETFKGSNNFVAHTLHTALDLTSRERLVAAELNRVPIDVVFAAAAGVLAVGV